MSDIYVFSSNDNTNDYTTMGLVGALTPTECTFKETANGESIVELTHPLDSFGRHTALQRGNILAVPVPVRTTPEIRNGQCVTTVWTYKVKPLNQLTSTAQRTLYMWRFSSSPKVAVLNAGEEITVIWKANEEEPATGQEDIHPWKAKSKYGEGWIDPDALELVTTHSIKDDPAAIEEIQSPWTVTKQYFRIYETKKSIDAISVTARHISYDLLYNMTSYRMGFEASLQEILDGVLGDCYAEHQFSAHTNLEGTQTGNWYDQRNPIDVFLNEDDGLCKRFEVDLIRNNYDLYFLKNPGINRGVRIQYSKNMTGIDFTTSDDEVATRIVPVGEKEDGTKLYLDDSIAFPGTLQYGSRGNTVKELQSRLVSLGYSVGSTGIDGIFEWRTENGLNAFKADAGLPENGIYDEETHKALMEALGVTSEPYIDSEHINDYPIIHVYELKCENCTVGTEEDGGGKVTEEVARARMREQAEKLLENGCDQPKIEMNVEFINLGDTEEYKQFRNLENCFLYDYVIVQHPTMDIDVTAQIMEIEWDCLLDRMVSVEIGSVGKTLANTGITSWQIPNGFSGSKIAGGTISGGALQSDIISVRHMQAESINTEALQAACVTAVKIAAGAIEATHISVEAIDAVLANIDTAVIEKAEIDWAEIASLSAEIANIAKAQITEANINQANINWANIANLTATVSNIANAIIEDATISSAQIDDLNAVVAEIIHAQVATGDFSLAEIENLLASAFILEQGSANSMMIKNLVVTDANLLNATIGKLIMPGDDGKYYEVTIGSDGSISTSEVTVTDGEISAGQMNDGRQIVTTTINADSINGSNVTAQQAILGTILTTALTAGKITAGEALLSSAVIPTLYTTSIQSIGNSLTFESNEMIQSIVSDVNSNAEDLTNYISSTNSELENLQGQIDGAITSWFYGVPPTNDNPPANEWTTTDQKNIHLGDLYYDTITGYCYRWQVQNNQYSWQRITDTDVTKALQDAEKAQDTADSKRRVFVSQPVPPYEVGDLWVQGSTGDILRCQTAKTSQQSYSSSDWVLASKYTDDTAADAAQATANANTTAIGSLNTRVTQAETSITQTQNKIELMASEIETELEDIRSDTDFATPYISAMPPEEAPEAGKLWLDEGVEPSVLRKWRGAGVTTEREYTEMASGAALLTLDNGAGQIESVAVEAGYRARQAGTGDPSPENIRAITGRESVEIAACGKNLFPSLTSAVTTGGLTVSPQADGTVVISGTATGQPTVFTYTGMLPDGQYTISGGTYNAAVALIAVDANNQWKRTIGLSWGNPLTFNFNGLLDGEDHIRMMIQTANDSAGQTFDNVVLSPQLEAGDTATAFESYRSMGGGTVTPTEPLYGLLGAEDTVDVSVDGDVTVTRRTAVLELDGTETNMSVVHTSTGYDRLNIVPPKAAKVVATADTLGNVRCSHYETVTTGTQWSKGVEGIGVETTGQIIILDAGLATLDAWKSYLAAQASAGTPVTIVYELAAPETEALTAISPIAPVPGQLNIATDAEALTATIHGSGWETVNDTSSIQDALANLDGDLASLINEVGLLNGEVGSIAQQIISPDGIKNIVFESTEYQAMANTVEVNANELSVTQATVTDINGRVETIEGTVRISGSNIDIGRSDSNVQLHLDNTGWSISEGGQETIYARQNRVVAPRFQTTSLIFGALAFNSSGGHFRLMKYGG